jgi:hypothetical protein
MEPCDEWMRPMRKIVPHSIKDKLEVDELERKLKGFFKYCSDATQ